VTIVIVIFIITDGQSVKFCMQNTSHCPTIICLVRGPQRV